MYGEMNALTLYQPWAEKIADGDKTEETRDWAAPHHAIGKDLAIHAGKVVDALQCKYFGLDPKSLPKGVITTIVRLDGCAQVSKIVGGIVLLNKAGRRGNVPDTVMEDRYGDFSPDRWIWFLSHPRRLDPPVPATGHQKIWAWTYGAVKGLEAPARLEGF